MSGESTESNEENTVEMIQASCSYLPVLEILGKNSSFPHNFWVIQGLTASHDPNL